MKSFISRFKSGPTPPPHGKENGRPQSTSSSTSASGKRPSSLQQSRTPSDTPSMAPLRSPTPLPAPADGAGPSRPHSVQAAVGPHANQTYPYASYDERSRTVSASGEGGKKVTFRSPIPTPATSIAFNDMINSGPPGGSSSAQAQAGPSTSSTRPGSPIKLEEPIQTHSRPSAPSRSSTSQSYSSRRSFSMRKGESPVLSPTPSDGSLSNKSYLPPPNSWSEMAADDLIANLGPRERTRQEVLYEIVSSEER